MYHISDIKITNSVESFKIKHAKTNNPASDASVLIYETYKISILLSDGLAAVSGNKIMPAKTGDVFVFRPDEIHFGRFLQSGIHEYLDIYLPESFFNCFTKDVSNIKHIFTDTTKNRSNIITPSLKDREKIISFAKNLTACAENPSFENQIYAFSLVLQLLLLLSTLYENQKRSRAFPVPQCVTNTLSYISGHYSETITLSNLSSLSKCSIAYLSKTFKKYTGISIYTYITGYRISKAKTMLRSGFSVTETCYSCGFNDCSNFIKTFKKFVKITPFKFSKA